MKKTTLSGVMAVVCICLSAQQANIGPFAVGDTVPGAIWAMPLQVVNHPQKKQTISLSSYKDKLIILDFWATWCVPCVKAFPELAELAKAFNGTLQIILATSEEREKIADFLTKRKAPFTSIVEDSILEVAFPKNSVPHEVWIKDGKIFAITSNYYVNAKTIKKVLNNELASLTEKKVNRSYNLNEPLLIDGNGGSKNDLLYHSIISSYLDGIGGGGINTDSLGRYKLRALNGTAFQLYTFAGERFNQFLRHKNRIINETSVKEKLSGINANDPEARQDFFCYELIVPRALVQNAPKIMIDDLNRLFGNLYGIHGEIKKVNRKCWVLRKGNSEFLGKTKNDAAEVSKDGNILQFTNQPFTNYFFSLTDANQEQPFPFIDKTSISVNIDMKVLLEEPDINKTRQLLESYGLKLSLEECEIEMLVLTDTK